MPETAVLEASPKPWTYTPDWPHEAVCRILEKSQRRAGTARAGQVANSRGNGRCSSSTPLMPQVRPTQLLIACAAMVGLSSAPAVLSTTNVRGTWSKPGASFVKAGGSTAADEKAGVPATLRTSVPAAPPRSGVSPPRDPLTARGVRPQVRAGQRSLPE